MYLWGFWMSALVTLYFEGGRTYLRLVIMCRRCFFSQNYLCSQSITRWGVRRGGALLTGCLSRCRSSGPGRRHWPEQLRSRGSRRSSSGGENRSWLRGRSISWSVNSTLSSTRCTRRSPVSRKGKATSKRAGYWSWAEIATASVCPLVGQCNHCTHFLHFAERCFSGPHASLMFPVWCHILF